MMELLQLYWFSILASTLLSGGLALLGAQLASRDRAMQTMCVGQGAMLGVLVGIGLAQILHIEKGWNTGLPFALAGTASAATYIMSERFVKKKSSSSNTHFAALFSTLLACGYLISALFPALENHMSQKYFGDLATMDLPSTWVVFVYGFALLMVLSKYQTPISRDSFAEAILGSRTTKTQFLFSLGTLVTLCISVQLVGFLFTVACLFLPTSILSFGAKIGLRRHLTASACTAMFACCMGFVCSLWMTKLPTVPTVIVFIAVTAFLKNLLENTISLRKN